MLLPTTMVPMTTTATTNNSAMTIAMQLGTHVPQCNTRAVGVSGLEADIFFCGVWWFSLLIGQLAIHKQTNFEQHSTVVLVLWFQNKYRRQHN